MTIRKEDYVDKAVEVIAVDLAFTATSLTASQEISVGGIMHSFILDIPNCTNTVTLTLSIDNYESIRVYAGSAEAQNQTGATAKWTSAERILNGSHTVTGTLSGASGSIGTVKVRIYMIK